VPGNKVLRETAELKSNHVADNELQNTNRLTRRSTQATEWNYISGNHEDAMGWACSGVDRDKSYCKILGGNYWNAAFIGTEDYDGYIHWMSKSR
jgi:hypothetical protein